jgi:myosin V
MKKRHMNGKPYTRTGDIIIAINPFQWFHELYTEKKRTYYSNRLVWEATGEDDPRDKIEPHVYEVSSLAYKGLAFEGGNQSILVSGESGAGKTETVKICMNHIASVQRGPGSLTSGDELDPVVKRVVESNPLLEAFGNAKTQRNDNSSRFGKYLQLQFDSSSAKHGDITDRSKSHCVLAGSKCDVYLLEKNRVTGHSDKERTYHIFYQLLAAPDSDKASYWPKLKGKNNKDFKYIGHTDTTKIEGMTDAQHYDHTVKTLALINITGDRLATLMRAIAIVMQCGNLTFGAKGGDKDKSDTTSKADLADLASLMGVGESDLTCAFTERTMKTKTEEYKVPLNQDAAKDACDAFAKEVYGKVFLWLVKEINAATCAEDNYKGPATEFGIVGLLDIFGFESFVVNRFEQLCINYANEKLQQKFTEDVFRAVQLEYEAEGIELAEITYDDNTDVLDLIEGRTGLLALLNEECVRPKGNDQQFVQKALQQNASSPCLIVNKMDRMSFGIHHYAGKVMYDADQFVTRNQDTLPTDLEDIGMKSSNEIVSKKFEEPPKEPVPGNKRTLVRQKSNLVAPTVWGKYKTQLQELMTNLRKTNSRYIRCIKPNMKKIPVLMEHIPTVEQLRCAGVVAAVTLARSAFPNRLDNPSVRFRYGSMWEKSQYPSAKTSSMDSNEALRCDCDAILNCALKVKETVNNEGKVAKAYVVGKTKSYFRAGALEYLEANRKSGLDSQAVTIQRFARGWLVRKQVGDYDCCPRGKGPRRTRSQGSVRARKGRAPGEARLRPKEVQRQNRSAQEGAEGRRSLPQNEAVVDQRRQGGVGARHRGASRPDERRCPQGGERAQEDHGAAEEEAR